MKFIQKSINFLTRKQVFFETKNFKFIYYGLIIAIAIFIGFFLGSLSLQIFQVYNETFFIALTISSVVFVCLFSEKITLNKWFTYLGGFIGFMIPFSLLSWYYNMTFLVLCDSLVIILPFMQAFGRLASVNQGCCSSNFGVHGNKIIPVHAYEIFSNIFLGGFMILLLFYQPYAGLVSFVYGLGYGGIRLIIEPYRNEEKKIFLGKYSLYQVLLTSLFWGLAFIYLYFSIISKEAFNMIFKIEYLMNSLSLLPLIFIMSLVAFITFGVYKKKGENYGAKAY